MNLAVAEEGCVFKAGDEFEDAVLFAVLQVILEAYEVVAVGAEVLLTELHGGVGPTARLWVGKAHGFHGAEAEGVAAAAGGLFDGETAFEVLELFGRRFPYFGIRGAACKMRGFFAALRMTIILAWIRFEMCRRVEIDPEELQILSMCYRGISRVPSMAKVAVWVVVVSVG